MQAIYHVDNAKLPWRRRAVFLRHLPDSSALLGELRDGPSWTLTDHLLDELRMELQRARGVEEKNVRPHSQRPKGKPAPDPEREQAREAARARAADRRRRIASGELT